MRRTRSIAFESLEDRRLLTFNPTADEQELLQLVNRFRTDPAGEFSRLISVASPIRARDPVLQIDLDYANVDGFVLKSQLEALTPVPAVAWNAAIYNFSLAHNARMIASNPPHQFHSPTLERRQALLDAGVNLRFAAGEAINSENVYGHGKSTLHTFASWVIDWQQGGPNGMNATLGHRRAVGNAVFEQVGHAITGFGGSNFGPHVTTQVLANVENPPVMIVGAVFEDRNDSGWYEAGEGLGQVQIVFEGPAGSFQTTSYATGGGYQVALPAGTYKATASGGGMKHAVVVEGIQIGTANVWRNIIYDPDVIPPDALESNNSIAQATMLTGGNQTIAKLSIHVPSDVDYFRFDSPGTGAATFAIQFSHAAGNLDLRLRNAAGIEIASSSSAGNPESITANLTRGSVYYIEVFGSGGAQNGSYSLTVQPPLLAAPIAELDRDIVTSTSPSTTITLSANDRDPDGDPALMTVEMVGGSHPAFTLTGNVLSYTAPSGFSGVHRASYILTDDQNMKSAPGLIEIFVVNFDAQRPWHNPRLSVDVNDDGIATPIDVLLIVNEINAHTARRLPTSSAGTEEMFGFLDTSGDGFLSALDVLLVVNALNGAGGNGEGEGVAPNRSPNPTATDVAFSQWMAADAYENIGIKRRRSFA